MKEQGLTPQGVTTTVPQGCPVPTGGVVLDGRSGSQEQEAAPQRCDEVDGDNCSCEVAPCGLLGARWELPKQELSGFWQVCARNLRNKSSHLGMEHPEAAGSGEVKTCRGGDVVEAGAEAILNNLHPTGLLIYQLGLEE